MYKDDKIAKVREILTEETIEDQHHPFMVLVEPKADGTLATISARPIYNDDVANLPFVPNVWNPIILTKLEVTSDVLLSYKVFIGYEASSL